VEQRIVDRLAAALDSGVWDTEHGLEGAKTPIWPEILRRRALGASREAPLLHLWRYIAILAAEEIRHRQAAARARSVMIGFMSPTALLELGSGRVAVANVESRSLALHARHLL
jgi:hypothetical protein